MKVLLICLLTTLFTSCSTPGSDSTVTQSTTTPNSYQVFWGNYNSSSFVGFSGATNTFTVDSSTTHSPGISSLKFSIPSNNFMGGTLTSFAPVNLTDYTVLTFWIKADSNFTIARIGLGNSTFYSLELTSLSVTTAWTKVVVPIPVPSNLDQLDSLFHFAASGSSAATSLWIADVQYEKIITPQPCIQSASLNGCPTLSPSVNGIISISGLRAVWTVGSTSITESVAPSFFSFVASDPSKIAISKTGQVTGLLAGNTTITAKLGTIGANGSIVVNVTN